MVKEQLINPSSHFVTLEEVKLWYLDNPLPPSKAEIAFPMYKSDESKWGIISNEDSLNNEAADPVSLDSTIPQSGRSGFIELFGGLATMGKSRGMKSKEIREYNDLKRRIESGQATSAGDAQKLLNYYGADLKFCQTAMRTQMASLDWSLLSNACSYEMTEANSPYMSSITGMTYPLDAWQKDDVAVSWANPAAEILTDIQAIIDLGLAHNKTYRKLFVNKKWSMYIRDNTQVQKFCATLMSNLYNTQDRPTIATVNAMLARHFDTEAIVIEVIDELVTRKNADGTFTTGCPFADGVAVFTQGDVLGHFHWKNLEGEIADPSAEYAESFYIVGMETTQNPTSVNFYTKGMGFPVVDTCMDNMYLKIDHVAWS